MSLQNNVKKNQPQQVNNNVYPSMFSYTQEEKVHISEAMKDVQILTNLITNNTQKQKQSSIEKVEQQSHLQSQMKKDYKEQILIFLDLINNEIEKFTIKHFQYIWECISQGYVTMRLKITADVQFECITNQENLIDLDFIHKQIYGSPQQNLRILLPCTIESLLSDLDVVYQTQNKNLIDSLDQKFVNAQNKLNNAQEFIQHLATQEEQDVMLILAVDDIQLNFVECAEQEEKSLQMLLQNYIDSLLNSIINEIKSHYEQQGLNLEVQGNFNQLMMQEKFIFSTQDKCFDEFIKVQQQILDQIPQYESICEKIIQSITFSLPVYHIIQIPIDEYQQQIPDSNYEIILLTDKGPNQFQIVSYLIHFISRQKGKTTKINLFDNLLYDDQVNSQFSRITIPYHIIDYFLKHQSPLSLVRTTLVALGLKIETINLDNLQEILQTISDDEEIQICKICSQIINLKYPTEQAMENDQIECTQKSSKYHHVQMLRIYQSPDNQIYIQSCESLDKNVKSGGKNLVVKFSKPKWFQNEIQIRIPVILNQKFKDNKTKLYQTILDLAELNIGVNLESLSHALRIATERSEKFDQEKLRIQELMTSSNEIIQQLQQSVELIQCTDGTSQVKDSIQELMDQVQNSQNVNKQMQVFGILYTCLANKLQFVLVSADYLLVFVNSQQPLKIFSNQKNIQVDQLMMEEFILNKIFMAKIIYEASRLGYFQLNVNFIQYFIRLQTNDQIEQEQQLIQDVYQTTGLNINELEYLNQTGRSEQVQIMIMNKLKPQVATYVDWKFVNKISSQLIANKNYQIPQLIMLTENPVYLRLQIKQIDSSSWFPGSYLKDGI